ncbi:MAG: glycosyltransferase family 4 protein [Actinomycetota bacterium]|nr:glycosyltransferase family 4 protein [Actinomycetota bacterium]
MLPDPRVLVLTPDFPPARGGIQLLVHRIVRHADRLRVRVVTMDGPAASAFDATSGLDTRRVRPVVERRVTVAALNARAIIEAARFRPAAVLSAHIVTAPAAALIAAALRVPFVQYLYAEEVGARPKLAAFALRRADATVAISRYTYDLAIAAGADPARVHRIPPGVDVPDELRAEPADRPTVLTIARISERYKGHDVMLRALPLLRARVPTVQWVVVGDGELRPGLECAAASQGLRQNVSFVGAVSDGERDRWLRCSHVFAMPSRVPAAGFAGEGFGIAYLEAGAHGLPVVAGNAGGALDAVVQNVTGVLVDPTDHVALADALADLLLDPGRARALGVAGAQRARELRWEVAARRVEELVLGLLADAQSAGAAAA